MGASVNALRDALLDAVDARDELLRTHGEAGMQRARVAHATVTVAAALPRSTEADVHAAVQSVMSTLDEVLIEAAIAARAHGYEHAGRLLKAGPGRDEGPIRREHLEARRALRRWVSG